MKKRASIFLNASIVPDNNAKFVADPFFVDGERVVFEVFCENPREKYIGLVKISERRPEYFDDVIRRAGEEFSFPFIFQYEDRYYCLPQRTIVRGSYKIDALAVFAVADEGPWEMVSDIGVHGVDPVVFHRHGKWYLACSVNNDLNIYHSDNPLANIWSPHPKNPVSSGRKASRMAGPPIDINGQLHFLYQDSTNHYGELVRAYKVTRLDDMEFEQEEHPESPVISAQYNGKWNSHGMHHLDFDQDRKRVVLDGHTFKDGWCIEIVKGIDRFGRIYPAFDEQPLLNKFERSSYFLKKSAKKRLRKLGKSLAKRLGVVRSNTRPSTDND